MWDSEIIESKDSLEIKLSLVSGDGEEGYPGEFKVTCIYRLNSDDSLDITYSGKSNKTTIANLVNHTYWNLSGDLKEKIDTHVKNF